MHHSIGLKCVKRVTENMGAEMSINYTMMGDTVNLAARLESSAKHYGVYNFVGENIYEATKDDFIFKNNIEPFCQNRLFGRNTA